MDIIDHDLCGLRDLIGRGELSVADVMTAYVDRIRRVEPVVNGFVQERLDLALEVAVDRARTTPSGPLWGLPYAVKDCLEVDGWITTFGTAGYRDPPFNDHSNGRETA